MKRSVIIVFVLILFTSNLYSQETKKDLKIFGYFQNEFEYQDVRDGDLRYNSFSLQQLNIFLQKDIDEKWTALVNLELINSYSSNNRWGAFNLEEAWIKYTSSRQFNLKLGLHTPAFNNFNEIRNRTPLMPYIIRPLAYETSFNETLGVHEFTPRSAFIQAYGSIPANSFKIDYSAYMGNSPNIAEFGNDFDRSGIDTTATFLLGGRIGVRYNDFKLGFSTTTDILDSFDLQGDDLGLEGFVYSDIERHRYGGDFSFFKNNFMFESEFIIVNYDLNISNIDYDKSFNYVTIGYQFNDQLFGFLSKWYTKEEIKPIATQKVYVPNIGFSYQVKDDVVLKVHYAPVKIDATVFGLTETQKFDFFALAISVI